MKLSYVIVTHQRRERLLATLDHLQRHEPLPADQREIWVVDNGSSDGTAAAVRERFPEVQLIALPENQGVGARNHAIERARGTFLTLLDDDSFPVGETTLRSLAYLEAHPQVGAVVGRVELPGGGQEACALPSVLISCAVCLRTDALQKIGGFRPEFFRKAGEYDLSYRLWAAGYRVERFEDLRYRHEKVLTGRDAAFAHRMDLRNNLILVERYLPRPLRTIYRRETIRRYVALARHAGHLPAARQALQEARAWAARERALGRPEVLAPAALEAIHGFADQRQRVAVWAQKEGLRQVVIADYAKNLFATWQAAREAGLEILGVAEAGPAFAGLRYRGRPVGPLETFGAAPQGVILANVNPAQTQAKAAALRTQFAGPVLTLWEGRTLGASPAPVIAGENR